MLRFDNAARALPLLKSILSVRFNIRLSGEILLFSEFMNFVVIPILSLIKSQLL